MCADPITTLILNITLTCPKSRLRAKGMATTIKSRNITTFPNLYTPSHAPLQTEGAPCLNLQHPPPRPLRLGLSPKRVSAPPLCPSLGTLQTSARRPRTRRFHPGDGRHQLATFVPSSQDPHVSRPGARRMACPASGQLPGSRITPSRASTWTAGADSRIQHRIQRRHERQLP